MASFQAWLTDQRRVYLDNAPLTREFRSQLRGSKAPWLLFFYLLVLVLMAVAVYATAAGSQTLSAAEAQQRLNGFFLAVVGMLEFLVALAAPVVAAASIVGEYQTRMIDLVFSSPMGAKYFLVGKLVSSYRYLLLLLVMAIPVSAVSVVLGGATWSDVLSAYGLVSFHGLLYMAVSVPIAVMTGKAVPTVVWSYLAAGAYFVLSSMGLFVFGGFRPGQQVSPVVGFSPMASGYFCGALTQVGPWTVPIWVPTGVFTLLFVKVLMLGAGSVLTQAGSKEALSLRIHGLLVAFGVSWLYAQSSPTFATGASSLPRQVFQLSLGIFLFLPYLSTWSPTGGGKTWPNGFWSWRWALRGTPASGLPYLGMLLVALSLGAALGSLQKGLSPGGDEILGLAGVFAFWAVAWSLGWLASSLSWRQSVEVARRLDLLFCFLVFVVPLVALGLLTGMVSVATGSVPSWAGPLNVLHFLDVPTSETAVKVAVLAGFAGLVGTWAERNRRKVVEQLRTVA